MSSRCSLHRPGNSAFIKPAEMLHAVKSILAGKLYYSNDVAVKLLDAGNEKHMGPEQLTVMLTVREKEILTLIAMELTNDEIAARLFVAKRTVDSHRQNLLNKLQVKNTAGLVKMAVKFNLVKLI